MLKLATVACYCGSHTHRPPHGDLQLAWVDGHGRRLPLLLLAEHDPGVTQHRHLARGTEGGVRACQVRQTKCL